MISIARVSGFPRCPKSSALHQIYMGSMQVELATCVYCDIFLPGQTGLQLINDELAVHYVVPGCGAVCTRQNFLSQAHRTCRS
jgi:hypothetical protein